MKEEDVYDPLIDFFEVTFDPEWAEITHRRELIQVSNHPSRKRAETDLCFGAKKNKQYELLDVIHVKTKENLHGKEKEYRELLEKARETLDGSPKVWIAIEESSYAEIEENIAPAIGVITYSEVGNKATKFTIRRDAIATATKFLKQTNKFINEVLGPELDIAPRFFVCSLDENAYRICSQRRLWGIHAKNTAGIGVIKKVKPGDYLLFRLTGSKEEYVGAWLATEKAAEFAKDDDDPWKLEDKDHRDFTWRLRMLPILCTRFKNAVNLNYAPHDEETGLTPKHYFSGMLELKQRTRYDIIFKKLVEKNLDQLQP